jgi:hypothetical protein
MIPKHTNRLVGILKTEIPLSWVRKVLAYDVQIPFLRVSHPARRRLAIIFAYLALLAFSLPVPVLHERLTDKAIETMRPVMLMSDGTMSPMLMPAEFLLLRWLGQISWLVVCAVTVSFMLSFWSERFTRFSTICSVAICECAFTTLYAFYATFLLSEFWIHRAA